MTRTSRALLVAGTVAVLLALAIGQAPALTIFGCQPGQKPGCGDDSGLFPPDAPAGPIALCENAVMLDVAKLFKCAAKCHVSMVRSGVSNGDAEDTCEQRCSANFARQTSKLTGCPACLTFGGGGIGPLASSVVDLVNEFNFNVYCQSPSGAFLETTGSF